MKKNKYPMAGAIDPIVTVVDPLCRSLELQNETARHAHAFRPADRPREMGSAGGFDRVAACDSAQTATLAPEGGIARKRG